MFDVVLHEPQIPPNTGNIIRLCANTGCRLHAIEPMGFELDDKRLRRAGLDYGEFRDIIVWRDWPSFRNAHEDREIYMLSTHHRRCYSETKYRKNSVLVFGSETRGLPPVIRQAVPDTHQITLPMAPGSRSLNLSNSVAVVVYEGWRQLGFANTD